MSVGTRYRKYLTGECLTFAIALQRELKLATFVLVDTVNDREDWIHAFVVNHEEAVAIDIRGIMPLSAQTIVEGANVNGVLSIRKATNEAIKFHMDRYPTERAINEARAIVRHKILPEYQDRYDMPTPSSPGPK